MHVGAAVEITTINGYDSFANVEDLYEPFGVEEESNGERQASWDLVGIDGRDAGALDSMGSSVATTT